ncbi:MAG: DUF512 domain-containing protein [Actinobacteria bacterium]|nr:DUF512 domain-containing protein [Actinomycetota bacterium]
MNQLPPGLRPSLYIRDDDYLLSYMYGNFITLTNLTHSDIEKIIKTGLSPLYISVHSLDKGIRRKLFGLKKDDRGPDYLKILDKAGIETHIQIVLVPGINDGLSLINTLRELEGVYKNILSIGIVPVGITGYNKNIEIGAVNQDKAKETIKIVDEFRSCTKGIKLSGNTCVSDEFFLLAGNNFPSKKYYGDYYQIENGIGKSRDFLEEVKNFFKPVKLDNLLQDCTLKGIPSTGRKKILIITSEYGLAVIRNALDIIYKNISGKNDKLREHGIPVNILAIKNRFLGGNIKITGLLSGKDIIDGILQLTAVAKTHNFKNIIVPDCILNSDFLTIDGYTARDIKKTVQGIRFIPEKGPDMVKAILDLQ